MSTTSTATPLTVHNYTPGNESELLNHMCVLVLAKGDGIPFNAASIQEEDIIKLCVKMGQTHLKGVVQLSVMELVILLRQNAGHGI